MNLDSFAAKGIAAQAAVDQVLEDQVKGKTRPRTLNVTRFLNREPCREFLLSEAARSRSHKFDRVSTETLMGLNEDVRRLMIALVRRLPSKGKTI